MTSLAEWILQSERPVRMQSKQRQSQLPEDQIFGTETILFMRKESNGHPGLCLTALIPRLKSRVSVLSEFMN